MCNNRGGFLPLIKYDATEFCQHSRLDSVTQAVKKRHCKRACRASGREWKCIDRNTEIIVASTQHQQVNARFSTVIPRWNPLTGVNPLVWLMVCLESNLYVSSHPTTQQKILLRDLVLTLLRRLQTCHATYLTVQLPRPLRAIYHLPAFH